MKKRILFVSCAIAVCFAVACSDDGGVGDAGPDAITDALKDNDAIPNEDGVDGTAGCKLTVSEINGASATSITNLTTSDDQDPVEEGIQLNIKVAASGVPDGTTIELSVTNLATNPSAEAIKGVASFMGVTVDSTLTDVTITPSAPDLSTCAGTPLRLGVVLDPKCVITAPVDGTTLNTAIYDVVVQTYNGVGGKVELYVGGFPNGFQGQEDIASSPQMVTFADTALSSGEVALHARLIYEGKDYSCISNITVDVQTPVCGAPSYVPAPLITGNGKALVDGDGVKPGVQTTIKVQTEAGVDSVTLNVDGTPVVGTIDGSYVATINLDPIAEGSHTLQAICTNTTTGVTGQSTKDKVWVDTTGPAKITDLACEVTQNRKGILTCTFTEPEDVNGIGIKSYEFRYLANETIDATKVDSATAVTPDPKPVGKGKKVTVPLTGMIFTYTYSFSVRAVDHLSNKAEISDATETKVGFLVQEILGHQAGDNFGYPAVAGDFNCDGLTDVAVGIRGANNDKGKVEIYLSTGTGLPTNADMTIVGTEAGARFGIGLADLNFNGDNCTDLLVRASLGGAGKGQVYLYLGDKGWPANWITTTRDDLGTGTGAEIVWKLPATAGAQERLGKWVDGVDMDGDGSDDVALTYWIEETPNWSKVLVEYGEKTITKMAVGVTPESREMPASSDVVINGGDNSRSDYFGFPIARGGHLNADNYEDLLIGARKYKVGGTEVGAAFILLGKARAAMVETVDISSTGRVFKIVGTAANGNESFGGTLAGIGDMNGDGTSEFVITDYYKDGPNGADTGEIYIFDLTATPTTVANAKAVITNDYSITTLENYLGRTVVSGVAIDKRKGADLNKDGFADLLVDSAKTGNIGTGTVALYFGATGALQDRQFSTADFTLEPPTGAKSTGYGHSTAFVADINGDGYMDVVVGDAYYNYGGTPNAEGRVLIFY
ncbi:MAG: hypothetical protein V1754_01880 [Pseudomonadota bacterium]